MLFPLVIIIIISYSSSSSTNLLFPSWNKFSADLPMKKYSLSTEMCPATKRSLSLVPRFYGRSWSSSRCTANVGRHFLRHARVHHALLHTPLEQAPLLFFPKMISRLKYILAGQSLVPILHHYIKNEWKKWKIISLKLMGM